MHLANTFNPFAGGRHACDASTCDETESVRPDYALSQTESGWTLTAYLPGVAKPDLSITDEDGVLRIRGERAWKQPEGWTRIHRESDDVPFELALEHEHKIDAEKIRADFTDGLLTLTLPKTEALKPRKIAVN